MMSVVNCGNCCDVSGITVVMSLYCCDVSGATMVVSR